MISKKTGIQGSVSSFKEAEEQDVAYYAGLHWKESAANAESMRKMIWPEAYAMEMNKVLRTRNLKKIGMILNDNFIDFIRLFNEHQVKYVLVGGWAVIFEGYTRNTGDIDFFIEQTAENSKNILQAIQEFCGTHLGFTESDFLKDDNIIMIGRQPFRIDILTSISGLTFEEVFATSHIYEDTQVQIRCIHINELIRNKKATARFKDLADAEMLEKILRKRKNR